jgi:hypothetical protein
VGEEKKTVEETPRKETPSSQGVRILKKDNNVENRYKGKESIA